MCALTIKNHGLTCRLCGDGYCRINLQITLFESREVLDSTSSLISSF